MWRLMGGSSSQKLMLMKNKEGKGKIWCKCESWALSLWRWGGCWREGASCQAVGHREVQQPWLLGHLQSLPAMMVTYYLTIFKFVPEKLNCLGIKVAGVSCGEARWIYQPTDEKDGKTFTHIEPSHSKCGEVTRGETWSNGRRFCSWPCTPSLSGSSRIWSHPPEETFPLTRDFWCLVRYLWGEVRCCQVP